MNIFLATSLQENIFGYAKTIGRPAPNCHFLYLKLPMATLAMAFLYALATTTPVKALLWLISAE